MSRGRLYAIAPLPAVLAGLWQGVPGAPFNLTTFLMGVGATAAIFLAQLLLKTRDVVVRVEATSAKQTDMVALNTKVDGAAARIKELVDWKHDEVQQLLQILRTNSELHGQDIENLMGRMDALDHRAPTKG